MRQNEGADDKMALGSDSSCFLKERSRRTNFNAVSPQRDRLFRIGKVSISPSLLMQAGHKAPSHQQGTTVASSSPKTIEPKGYPVAEHHQLLLVKQELAASSNQKPRSLGNKASPEVKSTHKQECSREEPSYSWAEIGLLGQGCGWRSQVRLLRAIKAN